MDLIFLAIIDMHQWAPKFGGNGLPDWAVEPYKGQDEAKVVFFSHEKVQQRFFDWGAEVSWDLPLK